MPVNPERCPITVTWYDADLTVRCVRAAGHGGPHRDGCCWFDDHGLRVPNGPTSAGDPDVLVRSQAGWKERAEHRRHVSSQIRASTDRRLTGGEGR